MSNLISRQEAIEKVRQLNAVVSPISDDVLLVDKAEAMTELMMLPSAEPVRMKGKWIFHETENDRYDDMICPFCKICYTVDADRIDDIGFTAEDFNFCPNCGADMR